MAFLPMLIVLVLVLVAANLVALLRASIDPAVQGRMLYQERSVRSKKDGALWFARRHVWVTDVELVLHLRADYGSRAGFRTRRLRPQQIAGVRPEEGGVRIDLVNAGETRTFLLQSERPQALLRAVGTLIEREDANI